jgi:D-alanine-D-alanine ligase
MTAQRVAVLMGGRSAEREISLRSGQGVLSALLRKGVDAFAFDPAHRGLTELVDERVDAVFIALHGRYGEDGTVQGALELLDIPYTGSGVLASALAMDKIVTKQVWSHQGIPTPAFLSVTPETTAEQAIATVGLPMAVKPGSEGSSLGFTKVETQALFATAVAKASQYDDRVLAEAFVCGREFTVALLGGGALGPVDALPVIEIRAPAGNYDFQNKYFGQETQYDCPANCPAEVAQTMQRLSEQAFMALGCEGWARVDLLWTEGETPTLLEINTSPGMTDHSLVPMAAAAVGLPYDDLVLRILQGARLKSGGGFDR